MKAFKYFNENLIDEVLMYFGYGIFFFVVSGR